MYEEDDYEEMTDEEAVFRVLGHSLEEAMNLSVANKTQMCRDNRGASDLNPVVMFGLPTTDEDGDDAIGVVVMEMVLPDGAHPTECLPLLLSDAHKRGIHNFLWVMFVVEGYTATASDNGIDPENYERGSMEKDFLNNPNTNIREGIIATAYAKTGQSAVLTQLYGYGDDGLPVYDEERRGQFYNTENAQQGAVPDVFYSFLRYCGMYELCNGN